MAAQTSVVSISRSWDRTLKVSRDTFSVRSHDLEIETTLVCAAMGHSMEVHRRSYRTHEAKTIRKAYERASENRQASRSKRQQQSAELEQLV